MIFIEASMENYHENPLLKKQKTIATFNTKSYQCLYKLKVQNGNDSSATNSESILSVFSINFLNNNSTLLFDSITPPFSKVPCYVVY